MPISNQYYYNQSLDLIEDAEALQLAILEELRRVTNNLIEDPGADFSNRIDEFTQSEVDKWEEKSTAWVLATLPVVYLRGIQVQDSELRRLLKNVNPADNPILVQQLFAAGQASISQRALERLAEFPRHHTAYSVMEADALGRLDPTRQNVFRSSRDMYRQVQAEALTPAFRTGETATRRDLSQRVLDGFAKKGVTGITYADGSRRTIESYAEMVGRTATRNASQQASMNRLAERGYDLVRVTQYAGASDLCAPWQGGVYSLSGESDQYMAFADAQFDGTTGLFHPNCFDDQTEVFTENGWRYFHEVKGAKILSLNPETHEKEYVDYVRYISNPHNGEMVHIRGVNIDLKVTRDHKVYVRKKGAESFGFMNATDACKIQHSHLVNENVVEDRYLPEISEVAQYRGMVYCLTLEKNHVLWVRRNGKTTWSGNCGHSHSAYIPGASESIPLTTDPHEQRILNEMGEAKGNRFIYQQSQRQRQIERNIRRYKKESATALNPTVRKRKQRLVRNWQERQRDLIDENPFLRRQYHREQI